MRTVDEKVNPKDILWEIQENNRLLKRLVELLEGQTVEQARAARIAQDPMMDLKEASLASGYSIKILRDAYRARELKVVRRGGRGKVFIRKSELDKWHRRNEVAPRRA